jgi:hypothetical protein
VKLSDLRSLLFKNLDAAAHEAATSPLNLKAKPTEGQIEAGNYPKGHIRFAGLDVTIENPSGSIRRPEWPTMQAHYGYIKGTEGSDGEQVDVFIRPSTTVDWSGTAFIIDQVDAQGVYDEHKVMLGYDDESSAVKAYLAHYPKGWKLGTVTPMTVDELKAWLEGDTTGPLAKDGVGAASGGWSQSSSATSGITAYGMIRREESKHKKDRTKLIPAKKG